MHVAIGEYRECLKLCPNEVKLMTVEETAKLPIIVGVGPHPFDDQMLNSTMARLRQLVYPNVL